MPPIKNYTSTVAINKSVQHIEDQLIRHGAQEILKIIEGGKLVGIAFIISVSGKNIPFRIPARLDRVEKKLRELIRRPINGTLQRVAEQAGKTAWKILSDWVDIQMTLIDLEQAELAEVFMPFAYDHRTKQTFFEQVKKADFCLLIADRSRD